MLPQLPSPWRSKPRNRPGKPEGACGRCECGSTSFLIEIWQQVLLFKYQGRPSAFVCVRSISLVCHICMDVGFRPFRPTFALPARVLQLRLRRRLRRDVHESVKECLCTLHVELKAPDTKTSHGSSSSIFTRTSPTHAARGRRPRPGSSPQQSGQQSPGSEPGPRAR